MNFSSAFIHASSKVNRAIGFLNHSSSKAYLQLSTAKLLDINYVRSLDIFDVHYDEFF